jgi:folate-binding protein YgfZ
MKTVMLINSSQTQPAIIELPEYSYLTIDGDKAIHFLQGQLTCDVNALTTEQALIGAYLNVQGRVITTLRIFHHEHQLLLQVPRDLIELVYNKLNRVALLSRVKIQIQNDIKTIGFFGGNISEKLQSYFTSTPTLPMQAIFYRGLTLLRVAKHEQFILIGLHPAITDFTKHISLPHANYEYWLSGLIMEKIVEINAKTSEQFTPHEIDLPAHNAVSFTKGCYVGQEIVARMQYLGKLKQHLQLLHWQSPPSCQILDKLFNQEQKSVGQIASIVKIDNMQYALAVLRDDHVNALLFTEKNEQLRSINN